MGSRQVGTPDCASVEELKLSYYHGETILITSYSIFIHIYICVYTQYGNLIKVAEQQLS